MKLNIRAKLFLAFGVVMAIAVAQGLFGLYQIRAVKAAGDEIDDNWLPAVMYGSAVNTGASDYRVVQLRHVLAGDDATKKKLEAEAHDVLADMKKNLDAYAALISSPQERALFESFQADWQKYTAHSEGLYRLSHAGKLAEAQVLLGQMREFFERSSETLEKIVALNREGSANAGKASKAIYDHATLGVLLAIAAMVAAGTAIAWRLSADIARRMGSAAAVADGIAAGNLAQEVAVQGADEIAALQASLRAMQARLGELVQGVRRNAEGVATASAQIAQGNADLSSRTEQQAAALEETAASMEQINSTATQNADNAAQANQLALRASEVARAGGAVVGDVVSTMRQIDEASRQIVEIITVIDGIAFQTNILALNAAVEAARAGEQGRGFAVVAAEVRVLAQRSAEAARQIKTLIGTSVERVEAGTQLADRAGGTMGEIVASIQRVSDIVGEIAAASREQMSGVGQTSEAVTNMDQATQQNAALVEQSAAAADSLRQQADALVRMVAVFRLGTHEVAAPARTAATPAAPKKVARPEPARVAPQPAAAGEQWASF